MYIRRLFTRNIHAFRSLIHDQAQNGDPLSNSPLYIETLGEGPKTVVFLPGLGGTTRYWRSRVEPLAENHKLVFVDLLGFGNSPKPWHQYSVNHHLQALHQTLAAHKKFTLVGHSLGGALALAYAARFQDQIENLVLISLPFFGTQRNAYSYFRHGPTPTGWLFTNILLVATTCIFTRRVFGRLLPYLLQDLPREVAEDLVKHTWRSSTSSLWEVIYRHDLAVDANLLKSNLGVHCIHGSKDTTAPVESVRRLCMNHANWQLHTLEATDHHPLLRDTKICLQLMSNAISQS